MQVRWVLCNQALGVWARKAVLCKRAFGGLGRFVVRSVLGGVGKQTWRCVKKASFV